MKNVLNEINKKEAHNRIDLVETFREKAKKNRQIYWLNQILRVFDLSKKPYEVEKFAEFIKLDDLSWQKCSLHYGDINNLHFAIANYDYTNFLRAFGVQTPTLEKTIPINNDCILTQDFINKN